MLTTTQLFVELLVIGIGPVLWVTMFLAAVLGYRLDKEIPRLDALSLLVVGGVAYALGTGVDRLARAVLTPVEKWHSANIKTGSFDAEVMERQILVSSEPLGRQIQYNRSRLRICRAWALNAFLILLAFIAWNMRVKVIRLSVSHCCGDRLSGLRLDGVGSFGSFERSLQEYSGFVQGSLWTVFFHATASAGTKFPEL